MAPAGAAQRAGRMEGAPRSYRSGRNSDRQGKTRIAELLPIRYARMKADPFAFLTQRGTYGAKPRPTKTACAQRQVQNERFWQIALVN